jgi:hypothetical protein
VSTREPRSTRPPYNEEQMFFIVHHRIVKKLSWPEIEDEFAKFFKLRSKSGLTSVYYRIRKSWGMEQVLKNQTRCGDDLDVVEKRADHLSRAFLENIVAHWLMSSPPMRGIFIVLDLGAVSGQRSSAYATGVLQIR